MYVDEDFKPDTKSLVDNWKNRSKDIPWADIDWIRASDIEDLQNNQG